MSLFFGLYLPWYCIFFYWLCIHTQIRHFFGTSKNILPLSYGTYEGYHSSYRYWLISYNIFHLFSFFWPFPSYMALYLSSASKTHMLSCLATEHNVVMYCRQQQLLWCLLWVMGIMVLGLWCIAVLLVVSNLLILTFIKSLGVKNGLTQFKSVMTSRVGTSLAPDPWNGVWGRCIHGFSSSG